MVRSLGRGIRGEMVWMVCVPVISVQLSRLTYIAYTCVPPLYIFGKQSLQRSGFNRFYLVSELAYQSRPCKNLWVSFSKKSESRYSELRYLKKRGR